MNWRWPRLSHTARRIGWVVLTANAPSLALVVVVFGAYGGFGTWFGDGWTFLAVLVLAVSLQSLLVIWLLSYRLERRVTQSLQQVTQEAQGVLGVEAPIGEHGPVRRSLQQIQDAFVVQLEQIREHERELAVVREDIDSQVVERTMELTRAKEIAEETVRLKSQFLANTSHELRTPLHAILSFSRFGMDKAGNAEPEKLRGYFANINESGTRLLSLLDDLLDLAKLEAGKVVYSFESDDLLEIVNSSLVEFACLAEEKECRFSLNEAVEAPVQVDRKRMIQVMRNMLSNAIKFSPVGGTIHLRVRKVDGAATVEVRDEGEGIPEEDLDGIFEKFVQARNISSDAGGTGLGLAICREIVSAHSGDIWVYNERQGGAVFVFSIPLYLPGVASGGVQPIKSRHTTKGIKPIKVVPDRTVRQEPSTVKETS